MTRTTYRKDFSDDEIIAAVWQAKERLGDRLTILGHHYQRDDVIQFADFRGDSLGLSQRAAEASEAQFIVFCGVTFMAETAAILCDPDQVVSQPVMEALCPMARMASTRDAQEAWDTLSSVYGESLVPITYQNSTAALKAFIGRHGGAVCTSSNARLLFKWAFERGDHILFMPDEHLGTNTALEMGIPPENIAVWDPSAPPQPKAMRDMQVIVWKGFCSVHTRMTARDVTRAREQYPNARIVVHPECPRPVVEMADASGSTKGIIDFVEQEPTGATVIVGTELNLVNRLQQEHPDKTIKPLCPSQCVTMNMTTPRKVLRVLDATLQGAPINIVRVDDEIAAGAKLALERMLVASVS